MMKESNVIEQFDNWTKTFTEFVNGKGKVNPGKYRAYGYDPPKHFLQDIRLGWENFKMRIGKPSEGTSPQIQEALNLNKDATLNPKEGEVRS